MSAEHTKGPWKVELDMRACDRRNDADGEYLAGYNIDSMAGVEIVGCEGIIPSLTAEANARLIAAAPEMLEALHSAISSRPDWELITDAIAKAEAPVSAQ